MLAILNRLVSSVGYVLNWITNPITNDAGNAVSLGRLLLLIATLKIIATGGPVELMIAFLVLVMYCWGNKPELREVVMCFANKLNPNLIVVGRAEEAKVKAEGPLVEAQIREKTEYPPEEKPPEPRKESPSGPLI